MRVTHQMTRHSATFTGSQLLPPFTRASEHQKTKCVCGQGSVRVNVSVLCLSLPVSRLWCVWCVVRESNVSHRDAADDSSCCQQSCGSNTRLVCTQSGAGAQPVRKSLRRDEHPTMPFSSRHVNTSHVSDIMGTPRAWMKSTLGASQPAQAMRSLSFREYQWAGASDDCTSRRRSTTESWTSELRWASKESDLAICPPHGS